MGTAQRTPFFFQSKPLFGLDIGQGSLKIIQMTTHEDGSPRLAAYGTTNFDRQAINDGVVTDPETIAKAVKKLVTHGLVGRLDTRRVALSVPSFRTFTRSMRLPNLKPEELGEAVRLEAEQYIPLPLDDLYLDYTIIEKSTDTVEVLVVAVPKTIVDSYLELSQLIGLEAVVIEPTMSANGRSLARDAQSDVASVIIDFGTISADISIYDHGIVTTGTVDAGGSLFTELIEKKLRVSNAEAAIIKSKYGLNKSRRQAEIKAALEPTLHKVITEIKRLIRYYHEYSGKEGSIQQVITIGGGANFPGLNDYFTDNLRLAVRTLDPWQGINTGHLQPPSVQDHPIFISALGLSLIPADKAFK